MHHCSSETVGDATAVESDFRQEQIRGVMLEVLPGHTENLGGWHRATGLVGSSSDLVENELPSAPVPYTVFNGDDLIVTQCVVNEIIATGNDSRIPQGDVGRHVTQFFEGRERRGRHFSYGNHAERTVASGEASGRPTTATLAVEGLGKCFGKSDD